MFNIIIVIKIFNFVWKHISFMCLKFYYLSVGKKFDTNIIYKNL